MTMHIPYEYWYQDTDLVRRDYLGLDYPPFAAMLHILLGKYITQPLVPNAVRLSTVWRIDGTPLKGYPGQLQIDPYAYEEYENENGVKVYPLQSSHYHKSHKYFLVNRISFAAMDILTMGPASYLVIQYLWRRVNPRLRSIMFLALNSIPMAVYFDITDTQINFLSMSMFLFSYRCLISDHFALSASFAILSFFSKQTSIILYLPYSVFVLSKLWTRFQKSKASERISVILYLCKIAASALGTLLLFLSPFLQPTALAAFRNRVFPIHRQIVAQQIPTFWYFIDTTIYQFAFFPITSWQYQVMPMACSTLILVLSFPALKKLFLTPSLSNLNLTLQICVMNFFVFGYSTHEKTFIWYILTVYLSSFEFSQEFPSIVNLMTVLIIRPMVIEFGQEYQALYFLILHILTHYTLRLLPEYPEPLYAPKEKSSKFFFFSSKLPLFLRYFTPLFQVFVAYTTVQYFTNPQTLFWQGLPIIVWTFKYMLLIQFWLVIYHNQMMQDTRRDITEPFFFDYHLKKV